MKRYIGWLAVAAVLVGAVVLVLMRPPQKERSILVHCGNSMRPAVEEIALEFQKRTGVMVEFNFGGTEVLFPQIKLQKTGDVFVCHDPFGDQLKKEHLLDEAVTVGVLEPVIIVQKGNPKHIRSLADVVKPGLRVGTTDPRYATCGKLVEDKLRSRGWAKSYEDSPSFVLQTRSHGDVAAAMVAKQLDAGIVWNFVGASFKDKVDVVPTGESFPATKVTVCTLPFAKDKAAAAWFQEFCTSDYGRKVFQKHGYGPAPEVK